ncbi:MAG TPA: hypothetical protein VFZ28_07885 [Burkholderiaceae bacterium]|nr:hypothetical protein [Burkholderiaceae bacterium]
MRVKSHWFRSGAPKSAEQQASAAAFIVWRTAHNMLQQMRKAGFQIDPGVAYFEFQREAMAFLIAVVDRIAHARMDPDTRAAFVQALVHHGARTLQDNAAELIGPRADGLSHGDAFIDLVNELNGHYAEFGADASASGESFAPDFGFVRYFASRLADTLPQPDQRWALDQVMASEAPAAVQTMQGALDNLLSSRPRSARRTTLSGD